MARTRAHSTISVPRPMMSMTVPFQATRLRVWPVEFTIHQCPFRRAGQPPQGPHMPDSPSFDLLNDLTWGQQEAVTHFQGPLLILAGAGSGKTRVITRRVAWLLQQGVRPGDIMAITLTNRAAGELRQRVNALVPGNRAWISTFHSL